MKDATKIRNISITSQERRWILILLDLGAINAGFLISLSLRPDYDLSWPLLVNHPSWIMLLNGLWFLIGYLFQVYDSEKAGRPQTAFRNVFGAGLISQVVFNFVPYLAPLLPPSRQPLFLAILIPTGLLMVGRLIYLVIFTQAQFRRRLLIIGAGWAGKTIYQTVDAYGKSLYEVVGFIDDDPGKLGTQVGFEAGPEPQAFPTPQPLSVLGRAEDLLDLVEQHGVTTIILAITHDIAGQTYQHLADCLQYGIEIIPMPVLYEQLTGKVPVEHIGDHWSVAMPLEHPGTHALWHATKRLFDIFWSTIGLIVLAILFPWIALIIRLDSPGPILYTQIRLGLNGKPYQVYKFRSMVTDAEQGKAVWAKQDDPRTTRAGKFLRKIHLDEFPQFLNILKGEMSVVGPRPERPEFIQSLAEEIPFYRVRLAVKPGMAGWGLIHQGYGASKEDALVKLQYDLYYIKHQSLWLDFYILVRTIVDALTLRGR